MSSKKAYLLAYNGACCAGWAYCTLRAASLVASGAEPGRVWEACGQVLTVFQTLMVAEIVHSIIGLVPSPVMTVVIQVGSRIFVLWGHTAMVPECQQHWSSSMMMILWGIAEVARYLFYFTNILGTVPYPIFWLRYSLFIVLYPTGISGEIMQVLIAMGAHWKTSFPLWYRICIIALLLGYGPGSPFMVWNMWVTRKRSFKKLAASKAPKQAVAGVVWPLTKAGDRSSTATNRGILATAVAAGPGGAEAAEKVRKEKNWRFGYGKHFRAHVSRCLESADGCLAMARAGLASAQEEFRFVREGHPETSLQDAMLKFSGDLFETAELKGSSPAASKRELYLKYGQKFGAPYYKFKSQRDRRISGMELRKQLDDWVEYGVLEADVAEALKTVQMNQDKWLDLSDRYFVLLGAASAMGPLEFLLSFGANVVAVARPAALRGILEKAKNTPGRVIFPVRKGASWRGPLEAGDLGAVAAVGGCDLLTQTPEIATWLAGVAPGKALTVGNYTYLDGALHVQICVACDCIISHLCSQRKDTAVAFLQTPTDVVPVTEESVDAAAKARRAGPLWARAFDALGVLQPVPASVVAGIPFSDMIESAQGPNYTLAKRLQHWRALVARSQGHIVSTSVSPTTATKSVVSNALFAAVMGGLHIFRPLEVVFEETSMTLMAAILVYDVCCPESTANPSTPLPHPLCNMRSTSCHGGLWRCPYTYSSMGTLALPFSIMKKFPVAVAAAVGVIGSTAQFVATGTLPWFVRLLCALVPAVLVNAASGTAVAAAGALGIPL